MQQKLLFILTAAGVAVLTVIICVLAVSCSGGKLSYKTVFYFVCFSITEDSGSASSLSDTVTSYGGAGYVLCYNSEYYVTVSCYYAERDAETVCSNLKKRGLDCKLLTVKTDKYKLQNRRAKANAQLFKGNLNTLYSLSAIAYDCANRLDTGSFSQQEARQILNSVISGLNGLLQSNTDNCFTQPLRRAVEECKGVSGYIHARDMRYVQILLADVIINTQLK